MDFTSKNIITTAAVTAALLPTSSFLMQESQVAYADSVEYRVITGDYVNFRKGPSTSYASLGQLNKGDKVEYISVSGSWTKVKYNGQTGYVYSQYVSQVNSEAKTEVKYVNCSALNVRSGASTSHNILGTVTKGNSVEIKDTQNGWHKINYKGNDGWVSGKYITSSSSSSTSGSTSTGTTQTVIKTGTVTTSSLNVRSGASTSYSKIGSVYQGKKVSIYAESNGWYKISYNGGYGWVSKSYVSTGTTSSGSTSTGTTNTTTTTKTVSQIKSQIATTYAQAKAMTGRTNFSQQCSLYVYSQLRALNIYQTPDTYWNGSQWYSKLTNNGKTRTGYTQKKYAGVNCLTNLVNANGGKDVYNVVVTFPRSYRSTSTVGHVLFIHAIKDGKVYYSDNYAYAGQPEGSTIVKSISEFTNYFSSNYSGITGAVHFVK